MNKNKLWITGEVLVIVLVIGVGWAIGIAPQLAAVATANQNRTNVEIANTASQTLLARLKQDYQGIDGLKSELDSLQAAVPASAQIPAFVTELNALANSYQVTVKSITVSDAKPYTPVAAPPTGTSDKTSGVTATNPKITTANFIVIPVQFAVTGDYAKVLDFVHAVQTGQRLFLIATFTSTGSTSAVGAVNTGKSPAATLGKVDSTIGGFVYVLLDKITP